MGPHGPVCQPLRVGPGGPISRALTFPLSPQRHTHVLQPSAHQRRLSALLRIGQSTLPHVAARSYSPFSLPRGGPTP